MIRTFNWADWRRPGPAWGGWLLNVPRDRSRSLCAAGNLAIAKVAPSAEGRFSGENQTTSEDLIRLHDQAHHACFGANSVKTEVVVEPRC